MVESNLDDRGSRPRPVPTVSTTGEPQRLPRRSFGTMHRGRTWCGCTIKNQSGADNPTSLYSGRVAEPEPAATSPREEVLATVQNDSPTSSFTTYCAMAMAWMRTAT